MLKRLALVLALIATPALAQPPITTPVAGSNVLIDHSANIVAVNVAAGATAGFILIIDSATVTADGTVSPIQCMPVAAGAGQTMNFRSDPITVGRGALVVFSSGASCFALVKSATAFISVEIR